MPQVRLLAALSHSRRRALEVPGALAVGTMLVLATALVALPLLDRSVSDAPVLLLVVPIGLCAVRYETRGGLLAAAASIAVASLWLGHGHHYGQTLDFLAQTAVFVLVGLVVGAAAAERRRLERAIVGHHELSLDLICTATFDGYFTKLNPAWTQVLGHELDHLKSRPFMDFVHPDDREPTQAEVVRQTEAGQDVMSFQNRYRCADGSYRWLEWTSRPDHDAQLLFAVARDVTARKEAEAAIATYRERLEREVLERTSELQQRTLELEESRLETLRRLALAAEFRDDETFAHTERVGRAAEQLARRLGLAEAEVVLIRQAAPLHDVGKLGISDRILLKPGKLTAAEFDEVRKHPAAGARILAGSGSDVLQLAERIALSHHEWWDGSGYPAGLAGEQIPLCARIVALADVYDALTHTRPYKEAWPIDRSVAEIRALSGRQFDPRVVAAFEQLDPHELAGLDYAGTLQHVA